MKRLVLDSNIIFSALKVKNSLTRREILNQKYKFYAPNFLIGEIFKHKERILAKSKAPPDETLEYLLKVLSKVNFIKEDNISTSNFLAAYHLCKQEDEKDTPFVALALELDCELWTRDENSNQS